MELRNLQQVIHNFRKNEAVQKSNCVTFAPLLFHLSFYELSGKGDNKMDQKASNDLAQTLSLFLEVPNLRDCVSISTVVHATISYLFSRHFPAFSVPRPILKIQN